jgi:hypothetical protein
MTAAPAFFILHNLAMPHTFNCTLRANQNFSSSVMKEQFYDVEHPKECWCLIK